MSDFAETCNAECGQVDIRRTARLSDWGEYAQAVDPETEWRARRPQTGSPGDAPPALLLAANSGVMCWTCGNVPRWDEVSQKFLGPSLKRCSRCQRAWFCDAECQKIGWRNHKQSMCQAMSSYKEVKSAGEPLQCDSAKQWAEMQHHFAEMVEAKLERPLLAAELNGVLFEPKCEACFMTRDMGPLKPCCKCLGVFACAKHGCEANGGGPGRESCHSNEDCAKFSEHNLLAHMFFCSQADMGNRFSLICSKREETAVTSETMPMSWSAYFSMRSIIPEDEVDTSTIPPFELAKLEHMASEFLSMSATVALALLDFDLVKEDTTELTIHVVGASPGYEFPPSDEWEEILHLFPQLRQLAIIFIGLEMPLLTNGNSDVENGMLFPAKCCPNCSVVGCKRAISFFHGSYSEFLEHTEDEAHGSADLVVAFNSGIHDAKIQSDWFPCLTKLVEIGVPCCFTSFDQTEAMQDAKVLRAMGFALRQGPAENPFKSLFRRPRCALLERHDDRFYSNNSYITLCQAGNPVQN